VRELFRVETDRAQLVWSDPGVEPPASVPGTFAPGAFAVAPRRARAELHVRVAGRPFEPGDTVPLFEQRDYAVYAQVAGAARTVQLAHRDPTLIRAMAAADLAHATFGRINFGAQVGRTTFTLLVDGQPEFELELEVFPSKLDYVEDFHRLLADVQRVVSGLAFEYLRATYQLGKPFSAARPSELEWILVLRNVLAALEAALRYIAARPARGLTREPRLVHASRVRRVDAAIRSAVRRGRGRGPVLRMRDAIPIRTWLEEHPARPTLDTPEHRWLAAQIRQCQLRLGHLLRAERDEPAAPTRAAAIAELEQFESRLAALAKLEVLAAATAPPPAGFASLQLISAPGYREAYRQCTLLALGLRIEAAPLQLSIKDLSALYEYWCYLAVLQIIAEETGSPIAARDLVEIQQGGLRVRLARGQTTRVPFQQGEARQIVVTFNPLFAGPDMLIAQRPDILISFIDQGWPAMHLVLDAKYRIDASAEYRAANDEPGPPQDALNVLHRYRDAILDRDPPAGAPPPAAPVVEAAPPPATPAGPPPAAAPVARDAPPRRSVIQAVALFPGMTPPERFKETRLWRTLERIGIGAIPLLPDRLELLREWLRGALARGGWELSDLAPRHAATEQAHDWRRAAALPVLIGVLRDANREDHLAWIRRRRIYYMPALDNQARQHRVARLAIYSPLELTPPRGAITHVADVQKIETLRRRDIETDWPATDPDQLQMVYHLGDVTERRPHILNQDEQGKGRRLSRPEWSSVLALSRAHRLREMVLETEPEWRLLETLRAHRIAITLAPLRPGAIDAEDPQGRAWFVAGRRRTRYAGASGFLLDGPGRPEDPFANLDEACDFLRGTP
jgi:hypothetical protein